MIKTVTNPKYKVGGHYSQGKIIDNLLYTCGHIAYDGETDELVNSNVKDETLKVLENLNTLAELAGSNLKNAVKITSYLTDMKYFKEYDTAFKEYFPNNPPPRTTVQVGPLLREVHVEIEAVIYLEL